MNSIYLNVLLPLVLTKKPPISVKNSVVAEELINQSYLYRGLHISENSRILTESSDSNISLVSGPFLLLAPAPPIPAAAAGLPFLGGPPDWKGNGQVSQDQTGL